MISEWVTVTEGRVGDCGGAPAEGHGGHGAVLVEYPPPGRRSPCRDRALPPSGHQGLRINAPIQANVEATGIGVSSRMG